jgi:hypothetical protein
MSAQERMQQDGFNVLSKTIGFGWRAKRTTVQGGVM